MASGRTAWITGNALANQDCGQQAGCGDDPATRSASAPSQMVTQVSRLSQRLLYFGFNCSLIVVKNMSRIALFANQLTLAFWIIISSTLLSPTTNFSRLKLGRERAQCWGLKRDLQDLVVWGLLLVQLVCNSCTPPPHLSRCPVITMRLYCTTEYSVLYSSRQHRTEYNTIHSTPIQRADRRPDADSMPILPILIARTSAVPPPSSMRMESPASRQFLQGPSRQ